MNLLLKSSRGLSFVLCFVLCFTLVNFSSGYSYGETVPPSNEESQLEKKINEPEKNTEYDGFIVSIKDSKIDDVSETKVAEETPSTESDKYYLLDTTTEALDLASASAIESVEPNYIRYSYAVYPPNDLSYLESINFGTHGYFDGPAKAYPYMGIDSLWQNDLHGEGVHVAVLDTGFNEHQDMTAPDKVLNSPDNGSVVTSSVGNDAGGHGTMVTSLIHAGYNNTYNIAGIADKAKLTSINVFTEDGDDLYATSYQTINAYEYLLQDGNTPDVLNCSYGGPGFNSDESDLLSALADKGCIIIAANGNDGNKSGSQKNIISYPANYEKVIAVGATDADGNISSFSSKNSAVDVSAWGEKTIMLSSSHPKSISAGDGTSFSSPIVAGIAACLKEWDPDINYASFLELIQETSMDKGAPGKDIEYGYGIINASDMLGKLKVKVTYETNGGTWNGDYTTMFAVNSRSNLLPTNLTKDNATFKGWYKNSSLTEGPYTTLPADSQINLTLYAKWGTSTTISFDSGNGTPIGNVVLPIGSTFGSLPAPVRTGYSFDGWYLDSGFSSKITPNTVVGALDQTIYAKWNINTFNVTYNNNGASTVKTYNYGSALTDLPNLSKTGYTFSGWYTASGGGSKISASTVVQSDLTLYAQWTAKKYTMKYNVNKGKKIKTKSKKVTYDKKIGKLPTPKRKGYKFKGWYTKKKGGKKVTAKTKVKNTKNFTVYAQWKKK